ncbi:MAG: ABC transporter ATP-binding protein, partial [Bacillota bacterium]|nr:ABC transporter ATP-binding protein [Bacillota bacterium]
AKAAAAAKANAASQASSQTATSAASSTQTATMPSGMSAKATTMPSDFFEAIKLIKTAQPAQYTKVVNTIKDKFNNFNSLGSDMIKQMDAAYNKNEYQTIGLDVDKMQTDYIKMACLKMIAFAFASVSCALIVAFLGSKIAASFSRNIRKSLYSKVIHFSSKEQNKFGTASLITRSTNDIQQIQLFMIMLIRMVLYAPILGVGAYFKVQHTGHSLAWIIGLAIGLLVLIIAVLLVIAMPKFTKLQTVIDKLNLVSREIVTGVPVIRAFSRESFEEKRFDGTNRELTRINLFVNRVMTFMMPVMMLIMNGISVLIVWEGAHAIDQDKMQVGDMFAFIQYAMMIIMSFLMISFLSILLPRAFVSMRRIAEVIKTDVSIIDPEEKEITSFDESKKGIVEFKNVSFAYPGAEEDVLKNISFTAKPGQTTAFIGSTGSGKTTLINLILRFFDIKDGEIDVDGADIRKVKLHDLREKIGYVPQKGVLFSGTIADNIAYSNDELSMDKIKFAAEVAQAAEFIDESEEGYDRDISQGGTNVSGGQRQRLSIARAIAKEPEIYIFDDSFSALDYKTDITLRKALNKAAKNSTILVVAQRINTVLNADQIVVLDDGEVVGIGTHKELMNTCDVYKQISESQLSKEELAQ